MTVYTQEEVGRLLYDTILSELTVIEGALSAKLKDYVLSGSYAFEFQRSYGRDVNLLANTVRLASDIMSTFTSDEIQEIKNRAHTVIHSMTQERNESFALSLICVFSQRLEELSYVKGDD
jgi:hypothetical protein